MNSFKKQFSSAVFYCWDIFRFLLTRRKTNAEILKLFGDSFSLHKVSFRGLAEKKCQKPSFHFSLPQHSGSGLPRSLSPWDEQKLAASVRMRNRRDFCGAAEHRESRQQGPRVWAMPCPAGTVPQSKAVTANSRSTHLHQSTRFSPPVQCQYWANLVCT